MHEIWHGDSVELCPILPKGSVNCVITDPPFGVNAISNQAVDEKSKQYARKIANDETPEQALGVFNSVMDALLPQTSAQCDLYIFTAHTVLEEWIRAARKLERHDFTYKNLLVWEKNGASMGDLNAWGTSYEFILFLKKGRRERTDKRRPSVINFPQLKPDSLIHPHEKPEGLLEILLRHSTSKGDLVVDPFGGSGSLVRAARNLGRDALAIEYDKNNYDKAMRKLNDSDSLFAGI